MKKILFLFFLLFAITINIAEAQQWANQELVIINNTDCEITYEVTAIVIPNPGDCNTIHTFSGTTGYTLPANSSVSYDSPNTMSYGPNYYPWSGPTSPTGVDFTWSYIRFAMGCEQTDDLIIAQCCDTCPPNYIAGGSNITLSCTCNGAVVTVSYLITNGKVTVTIN